MVLGQFDARLQLQRGPSVVSCQARGGVDQRARHAAPARRCGHG